MDMLTVDLADVPEARVGSPVVLWGEGLPVDDVAAAAGTVGYGATYRAAAAHRLGVVACGYADGYPRQARNGTPVLVCGKRVRLVGRVSMDMLTVDLTEVPEARVGTPVVLWGEGLPVDDVAYMAGTVGYELLCAVAPRVPFVVSNLGRLDLEL